MVRTTRLNASKRKRATMKKAVAGRKRVTVDAGKKRPVKKVLAQQKKKRRRKEVFNKKGYEPYIFRPETHKGRQDEEDEDEEDDGATTDGGDSSTWETVAEDSESFDTASNDMDRTRNSNSQGKGKGKGKGKAMMKPHTKGKGKGKGKTVSQSQSVSQRRSNARNKKLVANDDYDESESLEQTPDEKDDTGEEEVQPMRK